MLLIDLYFDSMNSAYFVLSDPIGAPKYISYGSSLGFGSLSSLSSVSGTSFRRVAPIGIIAVLALLHAIPVAFSHLFIISKSFSSLPSTGSAASAALAESSDGNLA